MVFGSPRLISIRSSFSEAPQKPPQRVSNLAMSMCQPKVGLEKPKNAHTLCLQIRSIHVMFFFATCYMPSHSRSRLQFPASLQKDRSLIRSRRPVNVCLRPTGPSRTTYCLELNSVQTFNMLDTPCTCHSAHHDARAIGMTMIVMLMSMRLVMAMVMVMVMTAMVR